MTKICRSLIFASFYAITSICAGGADSISKVLPTMEDTTVTLAGTAAGWKDSWKASAPNTFYLTDATGSIRVCIWPDDLAEAAPPVAEALKQKRAAIRLMGEVVVFRDRPEIHVKDGATIHLVPGSSPGSATAVPAAAMAPVAPR